MKVYCNIDLGIGQGCSCKETLEVQTFLMPPMARDEQEPCIIGSTTPRDNVAPQCMAFHGTIVNLLYSHRMREIPSVTCHLEIVSDKGCCDNDRMRLLIRFKRYNMLCMSRFLARDTIILMSHIPYLIEVRY
jgi:hypothetical protein